MRRAGRVLIAVVSTPADLQRLRGHLEHVPLEGGFWRLHVDHGGNGVGEVPAGELVVLGTPDELRSGFSDGDAVVVTGQLDLLGATVFMAGPRFALQSIEHADG